MIKQLEQNYAVRDKQDVLAMCALQYATQLEQKSIPENKGVTITIKKSTQLNEMIENHMAPSNTFFKINNTLLPVLV